MRVIPYLSFILLAFSISACDAVDTQQQNKVTTSPKPQAYQSPGKPQPPVHIRYELQAAPQVGVPLSITISLTPSVTANRIQLRYQTEDGLIANDTQTEFVFDNIPARQTLQQNISVTPEAEGEFYVRVSVFIDSAQGRSGGRTISIPVKIGDAKRPSPALPAGSKIETDTSGDTLIIQKGVETRRQE